ncbi:MAG: rSAM/selenodomain-associated transferase 2 [Planctomycetota bacterium]
MAEPLAEKISTSIIIPVLNEADHLSQNLSELFHCIGPVTDIEVIVCDGGSLDTTCDIVRQFPCCLVHCDSGRAIQMNAGADIAKGERLLFLHADSRLPPTFYDRFSGPARWGFFQVKLSGHPLIFRIIEKLITVRSTITGVAGGDQGLFFDKTFFEQIGRYPAIPLMEDIAICKLARRQGKPQVCKSKIITSSRRWQEHGIAKTILTMWLLRFAFYIGVNPVRLHRVYYRNVEK